MEDSPSICAIRGSINNDEYFYVKHIARPGETIYSLHYQRRLGGKGANQAVAITRAGGIADFYGTIGRDGLWMKEAVAALGLNTMGIIISENPTGRALIQIDDGGENSIIVFPGANHSKLHEERWNSYKSGGYFPEASHLLLQNEVHLESTLYALNNCPNMTTVFNPSPLPTSNQMSEFPWAMVDWLIVNEGEAQGLYDALYEQRGNMKPTTFRSRGDLVVALSALPHFATTNIICTLGEDGVLAFISDFHSSKAGHEVPSFIHLPCAKLQGMIRDTTGAGDCFTGYFVQGLMEFGPNAKVGREIKELDIKNILKRCVQAAAMCVERPGAIDGIPTRAEVEARMASQEEFSLDTM